MPFARPSGPRRHPVRRLARRAAVIAPLLASACGGGGGGGIAPVGNGGNSGSGGGPAPSVAGVSIAPPATTTIDLGESTTLSAPVDARNGAGTGVLWTSSAPGVATVTGGVVTGMGTGGAAVIIARAAADTTRAAQVPITVRGPRVIPPVTLTPTQQQLRVGDTTRIVAGVRTTGGLPTTASFVSSNTGVATVTPSTGGSTLVRAVGVGEALITAQATVDPTSAASATIRVSEPGVARIVIAPALDSLRVGGQRTFAATLYDSGNVALPARAALAWRLGDDSVATVTPGAGGTASVTARKLGRTTLTATVPIATGNSQSIAATATVVVSGGIRSIRAVPDSLRLRRGGQATLALVVDADPGVPTGVTWSSESPAVAAVNGAGVVTAGASGRTNLRATSVFDARMSVVVPVVVSSGVTSVTVVPRRATARVGGVRQFIATVAVETTGISQGVTWVSRDPDVAAINLAGQVRGERPGSTYIVAISGEDPSVRDSAFFRVLDPCTTPTPYTIGTTATDSVRAKSCVDGTRLKETYAFTVTAPTFLELTFVPTFQAVLNPLETAGLFGGALIEPNASSTWFLLVGPGRYAFGVSAVAGGGRFTLRAQPRTPVCTSVIGTYDVTATFTLVDGCPRATPQGLPNGTYHSTIVGVPAVPGRPLTATATSTAFAPLIEVRDAATNALLASSASQPASGSVTLAFTPSAVASLHIVVTTRQAGATGAVTVSIAGPSISLPPSP